jgi:hypothetical protein
VKKETAGTVSKKENILKSYLLCDSEQGKAYFGPWKSWHGFNSERMEAITEGIGKERKWREAFQLAPKGVTPHAVITEKFFQFEQTGCGCDTNSKRRRREQKTEKIENKIYTPTILW